MKRRKMRDVPGAEYLVATSHEGFLYKKERQISKLDILKEIYNLER